MVKFINTENDLKLHEIRSIETKYNLSFPNEYINHLLAHNGGQCKPNGFEFIEGGKVSESNIDWFLAIYDGEYDNLDDYIKTYKILETRIPKLFVPIAHDPGGNLICISCKDNRIYFWDHEKENNSDSDDQSENVYLIANNLAELFRNLFS